MEAFKIKHKPTGLFYQPHKHRGNTLSKTGKVYGKESYAKSALSSTSVIVNPNSIVYKITKDILNYEKSWAVDCVKHVGKQSDWEIVKL